MTDATASASGADKSVAGPPSFTTAAAWSIVGHLVVLGAVILFTRLTLPPPLPPAYNVELVAAPPGPRRALGSVEQGPAATPPPAPAASAPTAAPDEGTTLTAKRPTSRAAVKPAVKPVVKPAAKPAATKVKATPPTAASRGGGETAVPGRTPAGGGATGGRGSDVANVRVQGIAFPFPGYLENITRQIALNFKPRPGPALRAEVAFLIRRDGSVSDLRLVSRSGVYAFDLECIGAVEAVGQRKSFGVLPAGFRDDALPVVFSFDPTVRR
jgi:protein TonB